MSIIPQFKYIYDHTFDEISFYRCVLISSPTKNYEEPHVCVSI